jgi:hypothetical protein
MIVKWKHFLEANFGSSSIGDQKTQAKSETEGKKPGDKIQGQDFDQEGSPSSVKSNCRFSGSRH